MSEASKKLREVADEFYKQYREIQDKIKEIEEVPLAKALVGKYFKYRGSYGSNKSWWMYTHIVRNVGTVLCIDTFQEDCYGKIEFDYNKQGYIHQYISNNTISITKKEYIKAQKRILDKLQKRINESESN